MQEILSTLTSKGQITIPVAVRRHLGVGEGGRLAFVIDDDGRVELKEAGYSDVASVTGAAGTLEPPVDWTRMREIAREDRFEAKNKDA